MNRKSTVIPECQFCIFANYGDDGPTCHRNPPSENGTWPKVANNDFCGSWRSFDMGYLDYYKSIAP